MAASPLTSPIRRSLRPQWVWVIRCNVPSSIESSDPATCEWQSHLATDERRGSADSRIDCTSQFRSLQPPEPGFAGRIPAGRGSSPAYRASTTAPAHAYNRVLRVDTGNHLCGGRRHGQLHQDGLEAGRGPVTQLRDAGGAAGPLRAHGAGSTVAG